MKKFNFKRSAMFLGAAAVLMSASAADTYRDVTGQYMKNPAFFPGWQGAITDVINGVGEVYNGAFNLYQVLPDMPAGEYTLTVNAFYRCGTNDYSQANMNDGANHYASIYLGTASKAVIGLFDEPEGLVPNGTGDAFTAFEAGKYLNTLTFNHAGGDLLLGIKNEGGYNDEWTCFSNFKLVSGSTDYTNKIVNANFADGLNAKDFWNLVNSANSEKTPDMNKGGGVYRKTNASPYNFGQQVELPAGTYRFSALTFLRHGGAGNYDGKIISCKNGWGLTDSDPSPKQWFDKNLYDENNTADNAYLYMSMNEEKPVNMIWDDEFGGTLNKNTDKRTCLLDCWQIENGDYAAMPENETRGTAEGTEIVPAYDVRNVVPNWADSGMERESAAAFVNNADKYRQYVEFTLTAPAKVWLGLAKDENRPAQYWNPFADFKLEVLTEGAGVAEIAFDENAPVEYYNLQGVRVANPANGLYIVKQGNKVTKQIIK
ncbi:MAG: hypothetical protein K2G53_01950 [Muribaculaceae bacterium]|nr:hypothetical protein [Muribaculaceae bacterium]